LLTIRPATLSDAVEIVRVRRDAILSKAARYYDQRLLADWVATDTDRLTRVQREIADPAFIVLVAEAASAIIGFAVAAPSDHDLRALYTQPNDIGRVGSRLLAAIEAIAFERTAFLTCDASLNAEGFYRTNGYREECRKDHVSPAGVVSQVVQLRKLRPA